MLAWDCFPWFGSSSTSDSINKQHLVGLVDVHSAWVPGSNLNVMFIPTHWLFTWSELL